jgi:hypothetical protein
MSFDLKKECERYYKYLKLSVSLFQNPIEKQLDYVFPTKKQQIAIIQFIGTYLTAFKKELDTVKSVDELIAKKSQFLESIVCFANLVEFGHLCDAKFKISIKSIDDSVIEYSNMGLNIFIFSKINLLKIWPLMPKAIKEKFATYLDHMYYAANLIVVSNGSYKSFIEKGLPVYVPYIDYKTKLKGKQQMTKVVLDYSIDINSKVEDKPATKKRMEIFKVI